MLFYDYSSRRYFLKDEKVLLDQLKGIEERALKGEILLWNEYYHIIGLPGMDFGIQPIGAEEYNYCFEFELLPKEDCTVIYVIR